MQLTKRSRRKAFSLVEVMVGAALFGVTFFALYSGITYAYSHLQYARENLRATQIMAAKLEAIRLYSWDQVNDPVFLPRTFTANYVNGVSGGKKGTVTTAAPEIIYQGTVQITNAPMSANYSDKLRLVKIDLTWKTGGTLRQRSMQSLVTYNGLYTYVY